MRIKLVLYLATFLAIAACAPFKDALPLGQHPNTVSDATILRVHVDANGTLFPSGWRSSEVIGADALQARHSLILAACGARRRGMCDTDRMQKLQDAQVEMLGAIRQAVAKKKRVFVLVHGFNDEHTGASDAYQLIKDEIVLRDSDAVIEFFWDGNKGRSLLGIGRVWFWSVGDSQVVGVKGLRSVLAEIHDARVILISHSRGASVLLSALSNPAYAADFARETEDVLRSVGKPNYLEAAPLPANGNTFDVLMLAPAIGYPDFWAPGSQHGPNNCALRPIKASVSVIRYTVNPADPTLSKWFIPKAAAHFNATDLGMDPVVGLKLRQHFDQLEGYMMSLRSHDATKYATDGVLRRMLADSDVALKPGPIIDRKAPAVAIDSNPICTDRSSP